MGLAAFNATIVNQYGKPLRSPFQVYVTRSTPSPDPIPSLWADRAGTIPLGNPYTSLFEDGKVFFHVEGGAYKVTVSRETPVPFIRVFDWVGIGTAAEHDADDFVDADADALGELLEPVFDARYLRITSDPVKDLLRIGCTPTDPTEAADNAALINTALGEMPAAGGKLLIPSQRFYVADINNFTGKSITIEGSGPELSALIPTQTSGYFLDLQQDDFTDSVRLAGFSIECETASLVRAARVQFPQEDASLNRVQGRCTLLDIEIRGSDIAAHGFLSGMDLVNVHRPTGARVKVAGRFSGSGPSAFQHMEYGVKFSNSGAGTPTDYQSLQFSVYCAATAFLATGINEGLSFVDCLAVAVGKGAHMQFSGPRPWFDWNGGHIAAFEDGILLENVNQATVRTPLIYKREDSNADTTAIRCINSNQVSLINPKMISATNNFAANGNYNGILLHNCVACLVLDPEFENVQKGVELTGSSDRVFYRSGRWINPGGTGTPAEYTDNSTGTLNLAFTLGTNGNTPTFSRGMVASQFVPTSATPPSNGMYTPAANSLGWTSNSQLRLQLDGGAGANNTSLLLFDANSGTMKRVVVGAADSGGAGFRLLRIAN